jgi:transcriptional pleiotropic regulator of transition state genes
MDINVKDPLEIFTDGENVVLRKYNPACVFCGDASDVIYFNGKRVCRKCLEQLKSSF